MGFLRFLEGIRLTFFNGFFSGVTYLGDEIVFIVLGLFLYWCVGKKEAYFMFAAGLLNALTNQTLKLVFRVPRPWVLDPDFTIVEQARAAAVGYSLPSGHTQNAVGVFGTLWLSFRNKTLRWICVVLMLIIPFSRMYLGAHTPLDVATAFVLSLAAVAALYPFFKDDARAEKTTGAVLGVLGVLTAAYFVAVMLWQPPADIDPVNLDTARRQASDLLAVAVALALSYMFDNRFTHFRTDGTILTQAVKAVLGIGFTVLLKTLLKAPLNAAFGNAYLADGVRYFIIAFFATSVWPMAFPLIGRICGGKKDGEKTDGRGA